MENTLFFASLTAAQQRKFMAFADAYGRAYEKGQDGGDQTRDGGGDGHDQQGRQQQVSTVILQILDEKKAARGLL